MKQYIQQILDDIEKLSQIADAVDVQREANATERNTLLSRISELEAIEREEGEKWREFAAEIAPPGTPLAASGMISFGKLKEVVEAAIALPTRERDGARLALQAAQRELTRLRTLERSADASPSEGQPPS